MRYIITVGFFLAILIISCKQNDKQQPASVAGPQTPLEKLSEGNKHFASFNPVHPDEDTGTMHAAAKGQHPFAVVVTCSDSRVSPELIFDQGIGDLFVIRTAGNIISEVELGSVEYAVEHLGVKLIVVMGHENCGAVSAYVAGGQVDGHLQAIIDSLKNETEIKSLPDKEHKTVDDFVRANVLHGIHQLQAQSEIIHEKVAKNELQIVGARYDLDNYKVEIIDSK